MFVEVCLGGMRRISEDLREIVGCSPGWKKVIDPALNSVDSTKQR